LQRGEIIYGQTLIQQSKKDGLAKAGNSKNLAIRRKWKHYWGLGVLDPGDLRVTVWKALWGVMKNNSAGKSGE
jgi:hypothetical protein